MVNVSTIVNIDYHFCSCHKIFAINQIVNKKHRHLGPTALLLVHPLSCCCRLSGEGRAIKKEVCRYKKIGLRRSIPVPTSAFRALRGSNKNYLNTPEAHLARKLRKRTKRRREYSQREKRPSP